MNLHVSFFKDQHFIFFMFLLKGMKMENLMQQILSK